MRFIDVILAVRHISTFARHFDPFNLKSRPLDLSGSPTGVSVRLIDMKFSGSDAWREYRLAFQEFSQKARKVQLLTAQPSPDKAAIVSALVDLEKVRIVYNAHRDEVASQLLAHALPEADSSQAKAARIKQIAGLLWEIAGKPEGTADDDWHRAEEIIRTVAA